MMENLNRITCENCEYCKIWYDKDYYTMRMSCTAASKRGKTITWKSYPTYEKIMGITVKTKDTIETIENEFRDYAKRRLAPTWCKYRKGNKKEKENYNKQKIIETIKKYNTAKKVLQDTKESFKNIFDKDQAEFIVECLDEHEDLTIDQILTFAKPEYDFDKMYYVGITIINNSPQEIINLFINTDFDDDQRLWIYRGIGKGLSVNQILSYAKPEIPWKNMRDKMYELCDK